MSSNSKKTHNGLRAVLVAAAMLAAGSSAAEAATLASGPLRVADQQYFTCSVANVGTGDVAAKVDVTIAGGGYGAASNCPALAPAGVCAADNQAGSANYRYCTITTSNRKAVRGTFCNTSTGICVPVQ